MILFLPIFKSLLYLIAESCFSLHIAVTSFRWDSESGKLVAEWFHWFDFNIINSNTSLIMINFSIFFNNPMWCSVLLLPLIHVSAGNRYQPVQPWFWNSFNFKCGGQNILSGKKIITKWNYYFRFAFPFSFSRFCFLLRILSYVFICSTFPLQVQG